MALHSHRAEVGPHRLFRSRSETPGEKKKSALTIDLSRKGMNVPGTGSGFITSENREVRSRVKPKKNVIRRQEVENHTTLYQGLEPSKIDTIGKTGKGRTEKRNERKKKNLVGQ